VKNVWSVSW